MSRYVRIGYGITAKTGDEKLNLPEEPNTCNHPVNCRFEYAPRKKPGILRAGPCPCTQRIMIKRIKKQ